MMFITAYEETLKVVREKDPAILPQAEFKLTWAYFSILDRMLQEEDYRKIPEYPRVLRFLKRNTVRIIRSPYFHRARKAGAAALLVNVRLYRQMIRMNAVSYTHLDVYKRQAHTIRVRIILALISFGEWFTNCYGFVTIGPLVQKRCV